jgi:type IV pilus assembly protein PilY1
MTPENYCANNSIVLLTDGVPYSSFQSYGKDRVDPDGNRRWDRELTLNIKYEAQNAAFRKSERECTTDGTSVWTRGTYSQLNTSKGGCLLDAVKFLANTDLRPDETLFPGKQTITTHTVGINSPANTIPFLNDISKAGNGKTYYAGANTDLTEVFKEILDVAGTNVPYSYNSVSLPADLSDLNGVAEFAYIPLLKPELKNIWYGNLKKYKYELGASADMAFSLKDANGNSATEADGTFRESQIDYWGTTTGNTSILNGVAGLLNAREDRVIYTENGSNGALKTLDKSYEWFTSTALPVDGIITITDENGKQQTSTISKMGAPIHTQPITIKYPDYRDQTILYLPTSEGVLHAFDSETGEELWGFMPNVLLKNIDILQNNPTRTNHGAPEYGLDGQPVVFSISKSGGEEQKILVFGMRRGGQNYYALDVTSPGTPALLWKIEGGAGQFAKLGQTWAPASPMQIKYAGESVPVIVLAGGYDANHDIEGNPLASKNNEYDGYNEIGNAIYVVNALTGKRLFWISGEGSRADIIVNDMKNSLVTAPEVVHLDSDSFADRLYFSDVGGRIIRVDIDNEITDRYNSTNKNQAIKASILVDVNDIDTQLNYQFFNKPAVSKIKTLGGKTVFGISIGSGYRPDLASAPEGMRDRFFTFYDDQPFTRNYQALTPITSYDLYDATSNVLQDTSNPEYNLAVKELNTKSGWFIDLGTAGSGEKSVNKAAVHNGVVYFSTYMQDKAEQGSAKTTSTNDTCDVQPTSNSISRFYSISLRTAAAVNPNNDGVDDELATADRSTTISSLGIAPEINISRVNSTSTDAEGNTIETVETIVSPCLSCNEIVDTPDRLYGISWEELR